LLSIPAERPAKGDEGGGDFEGNPAPSPAQGAL